MTTLPDTVQTGLTLYKYIYLGQIVTIISALSQRAPEHKCIDLHETNYEICCVKGPISWKIYLTSVFQQQYVSLVCR